MTDPGPVLTSASAVRFRQGESGREEQASSVSTSLWSVTCVLSLYDMLGGKLISTLGHQALLGLSSLLLSSP